MDATATPIEIDTQLAALYQQEDRAEQHAAVAMVSLRQALGQRQGSWGRPRAWPISAAETLADAAARAQAGETAGSMHSYRPIAEFLARYQAAHAAVEAVRAAAVPLHAEYARRGWTRCFAVSGGHIHKSMDCSTCHRGETRTRFDWLPAMSGMDEAAALAELGRQAFVLCTVCYPNAPVLPAQPSRHCPGSSNAPVPGTRRTCGMTTYARCAGCGESERITQAGVVRKHPPKK